MSWKNKFREILKGLNSSFLSNSPVQKTWFTLAKAFPFSIFEFATRFSKANKAEVLWALLSSGRDPLEAAPRISMCQCGWKEIIYPTVFLEPCCTRRVLCGLLFHPCEGILLFFLFFFTILLPNPVFLGLSKVHLSGALEGRGRNSVQKFLHLNRMVFILLTMIEIKLGIE